MTYLAPAVNPANAFWKLPDKIELDAAKNAEQFAAFLKARVPEHAAALDAARPFSQHEPTGNVSAFPGPPPWAPAMGLSHRPVPDSPAPVTEGPEPLESLQPSSPSEPVEPEPAVRPFTPRYKDVPDSWKWPIGPYRQAPPEFGGEWWLVNPFTGGEPWRPAAAEPSADAELPEGFLEVFGPPPQSSDFSSSAAFQAARLRWEQDLEYFRHSGVPEGFDQAQVDLAAGVFEDWGLGRPVFYEGRYGWMARFPGSSAPAFEANAATTIELPHLIVAKFQTRQLADGIMPPTVHPFVPPILTETEA